MYKLLAALILLLALAPAKLASQPVTTPQIAVIGCAYNTALPTLTAATFGLVQCDVNGQLLSAGSYTQNSSTSGLSGTLVLGAVTTAAPTYTTGKSNPISLDTAGNLRTNCVTGCSSTLSTAGFDTNFTVTPTVQASAYTANYSLGGWQQIAVFRNTTQPSGMLNYISLASKGGATTATTIWAFNKSSANLTSTCTDKTLFSLTTADVPSLIPGFPIVLTPAASNAQTPSVASQPLVVSVANTDGILSTNLTFCIVTNGTPTPGSTTDIIFGGAIAQD